MSKVEQENKEFLEHLKNVSVYDLLFVSKKVNPKNPEVSFLDIIFNSLQYYLKQDLGLALFIIRKDNTQSFITNISEGLEGLKPLINQIIDEHLYERIVK